MQQELNLFCSLHTGEDKAVRVRVYKGEGGLGKPHVKLFAPANVPDHHPFSEATSAPFEAPEWSSQKDVDMTNAGIVNAKNTAM
jgi:hypothetical protein